MNDLQKIDQPYWVRKLDPIPERKDGEEVPWEEFAMYLNHCVARLIWLCYYKPGDPQHGKHFVGHVCPLKKELLLNRLNDGTEDVSRRCFQGFWEMHTGLRFEHYHSVRWQRTNPELSI